VIQISDFKAKMHQVHFLLGLRPRPSWGSLQCPPHHCLYLRRGKRERGRKGKGEGRGEVEGGIWPTQKFWCGAPYGSVPSSNCTTTLNVASQASNARPICPIVFAMQYYAHACTRHGLIQRRLAIGVSCTNASVLGYTALCN